MIDFEFPWVWLLFIPAAWFVLRRRLGYTVKTLEFCAVAALFFAASGLVVERKAGGSDVVVVCDRSKSIANGFLEKQKEIIDIIKKEKKDDSRIGIVSFGRNIKVRKFLGNEGGDYSLSDNIDADATFLNKALETALNMIPKTRNGKIFLISDGLYNGFPPHDVVLECADRNIPVYFRYHGRKVVDPLCIISIEVPGKVEAGTPFQISAVFKATVSGRGEYTLRKGTKVVARGTKEFSPGLNVLRFRDVGIYPGIETYSVEIDLKNDPVPENNTATASVRVTGKKRICVISPNGRKGNLAAGLRSGGVDFDIISPGSYIIGPELLDGYRAVVIENVPATAFSTEELEYLMFYVKEEGGGLMLTGGRNSFGPGGYCRSPLEEGMPVSMEVRKEHRKVGIALGIVLDRSGSMAVSVGMGKTKMDLANRGASSSIELLTEIDAIGVIAVDSLAHLIVPFSKGNANQKTAERILRIKSMGGGIFVFTGLVAMGKMISRAPYQTRHIILFADAADAEEPGKYQQLLADFRQMGITVSVVALGQPSDGDAAFLKDIAARGGGNIFFTVDPLKLPALFSMDTVSIVRESFIDESIQGRILNDIYALGEISGEFPLLGGYNQTYAKQGSSLGVLGTGKDSVPLFAFRQYGLGRTAAVCFEVDGETSGDFISWNNYSSFFTTVTRWLSGVDPPLAYRTRIERKGHAVEVYLEIDPDHAKEGFYAAPELIVLSSEKGKEPVHKILEWVGPYTLKGEFILETDTMYRPVVRIGEVLIKADPVRLPVSPEFEFVENPGKGEKFLRTIAERTGGGELVNISDLFVQAKNPVLARKPLVFPFIIAALVLFLVEIAERRFFWGLRLLSGLRSFGRSAGAYVREHTGKQREREKGEKELERGTPEIPAVSNITDEQPEQIEEREVSIPEKKKSMDSILRKAKKEAKKRF